MDLSTSYLGFELKHPIVASPSPLTRDIDGIRRLVDAGAAAVVMASVFEQQVAADSDVLKERLETLRQASKQGGVPIIASLNGETLAGWVDFAKQLEEAGASAIELDLYRVPADPNETGQVLEQGYVDILRAVKAQVHVPVAVKLSPYFSAPANMAKQLVEAGADGLVLFNRFYEGDIDLEFAALQVGFPAQHALRHSTAVDVDIASLRKAGRVPGGDLRRVDLRGGREIPPGRRRCSHDDLVVAERRAAAPGNAG